MGNRRTGTPTLLLTLHFGVLCLATTVQAELGVGEVEIRFTFPAGMNAKAIASLRSTEEPHLAWTARASEKAPVVRFTRVPPGGYRVLVEAAGVASAAMDVYVEAGALVTLSAVLALDRAARLTVIDRHRPAYGTAFAEDHLRDLPSSRTVWSLLETAETSAIVDRLDNGGLFTAEPGRVGIHGSSWTQTTYRLGDLDITDPNRTGTPLLHLDLEPLVAIDVASGTPSADTGGTGPLITLAARRPTPTWRGSAQALVTSAGLQASRLDPQAPAVARFGSWGQANLTISGPLLKDRLGVLVSASLTRARRFERDDPAQLEARVGSVFTHWLFTPRAGDEVRFLGIGQALRLPYAGRARFLDQEVREDDEFLHTQATWEHRARPTWALSGGYQRGAFDPRLESRSEGRAIERLRDGPVPELIAGGRGRRERWDLRARLEPGTSQVWGAHHALDVGLAAAASRAVTRLPGLGNPIPELVNGLPARVWDYNAGSESRWHATELAAHAQDRILLTPRASLDAGLRLEWSRASAVGSPERITWGAFLPRIAGRWRLAERGQLTVFGGYARYRHSLPLGYLAFGDDSAPQATVYRWNDANGDRLFQALERGPLLARAGPGSGGTGLTSLDPELKPPLTDELLLGIEGRIRDSLVVRLAGIHRRARKLVESVNVGVPLSSYSVRLVPDAGGDLLGSADDQLLAIYNRDPAGFGADRYLLTNPEGLNSLYEGLELTIERPVGRRLRFLLSATASRSVGPGGNRGFRVAENDAGLIGERLDQPNADTFSRGRLFFDRAYTIKLSGRYHAPGDLRLGVVARYQDGQPFARVVIAPDLNQGPEAIPAVRNGRHRFAYTLTVDARLEKGLAIGKRRLAASLEAFNLLDTAHEVEEDVVTGPSFRTPTVVQPPRVLRLGLRVDF